MQLTVAMKLSPGEEITASSPKGSSSRARHVDRHCKRGAGAVSATSRIDRGASVRGDPGDSRTCSKCPLFRLLITKGKAEFIIRNQRANLHARNGTTSPYPRHSSGKTKVTRISIEICVRSLAKNLASHENARLAPHRSLAQGPGRGSHTHCLACGCLFAPDTHGFP